MAACANDKNTRPKIRPGRGLEGRGEVGRVGGGRGPGRRPRPPPEFWVVYFCRLRRLPSSPLLAEICWKNRELFKVFFVFLFLPLLLLLLVFFLLSPLLSFPTTHLDCDLLYIEVWNFGVRVISQCCEASSKGWESEGKRSGRMVGMAAARELLYSATDHFFTHFDFQVLMNGEPCPRAWPLSCFPSFPENLSAYRVISST
jgi:hypothetical protein